MAALTPPVFPPAPYQSPVADQQGLLTPAWSKWFTLLFTRVGGFVAPTNKELATQVVVDGIQDNLNGQGLTLQSLENEIDDLKKGRNL